MKIGSEGIFNMGDTSLRLKKQVQIYRVILELFTRFFSGSIVFHGNRDVQEEFYRFALEEITRMEEERQTFLFNDLSRIYQKPAEDKIGKRGRTWTSALVKNGLLSAKRELSEVARHYLDSSLEPADDLEKLLSIDVTNLLYFRQYLKLRLYCGNFYVHIFRIAIKMLVEHGSIPRAHFLRILMSIKTGSTHDDIAELIRKYGDVKNRAMDFERWCADNLPPPGMPTLDAAAASLAASGYADAEEFRKVFSNRKSGDTCETYREFVLALVDLRDNRSENAFRTILSLNRDNAIKRAFGFGAMPLKPTGAINEFLEENADSPLLSNNRADIYLRFKACKHADLIGEYSDMCIRSFKATGIVNFDKDIVTLNGSWLFEAMLKELGDRFTLAGTGNIKEYEDDLSSVWFRDVTTTSILDMDNSTIRSILDRIALQFGEPEKGIQALIDKRAEDEFRDFVNRKFPRETTVEILRAIDRRDDDRVHELVTDAATVPTIFEYIVTIAWHHLSEGRGYQLHKSFQTSLDSGKLPLLHRGGGAGDIEIVTGDYALLIECTLMDENAQKKGEMEPVIRHSVNFNADNRGKDEILTIFVANALDRNTANIFRAMRFVSLAGKEEVHGVRIFSITTSELAMMLEKGLSAEWLFGKIREHDMAAPAPVRMDWRDPVVRALNEA